MLRRCVRCDVTGKGVVSKSPHEVEEDERQSDGEGQGYRTTQAGDDRTPSSPAGDGQTETYVTSSVIVVKDQQRDCCLSKLY